LGAGTALPGLLAAKLGARVILTDKHDNHEVLGSYTRVSEINGVQEKVSMLPLKWGLFDAGFFELPKLDAIIAADCFYDPKDFDNILATVFALMKANPSCVFVTVYQERSSRRSLQPLLLKWGMSCRAVEASSFGFDEEKAENYGAIVKDFKEKVASLFLFEIFLQGLLLCSVVCGWDSVVTYRRLADLFFSC